MRAARMLRQIAAVAGSLAAMLGTAAAADYPTPVAGDWVAPNFRFHTGEVMPALRLHYTTVGAPSGRAGADPAWHRRHRPTTC